jgi:excisionase family DNA binding protein
MERLLDVDEVRSRLNIGRTRTYELIQTGELPSLKIGSLRRVPESSLARFIAERTTGRETSSEVETNRAATAA